MKKRIPVVIAVIAIAGVAWWGYSTYIAEGGEDVVVLGGSGTIEADEVSVSPLLAGRIATATATEGTPVAAGDVLFMLSSDIVDAQVAQAEAGVRAAEAMLEQVKNDDGRQPRSHRP